MNELKKFFVLGLPQKEERCPNALYIVKTGEDTVKLFFTDQLRNALEPEFNEDSGEDVETNLTSDRGTIEILNVGGNINIEVAQYILDAISIEVVYVQPSSTLTLGVNLVEAGSTVDRTITSTFVQNDAGPVNRQRISKGNTIILDSFSTDSVKTVEENITVSRGSIVYSSIIDYDRGPVKTNNLGQADDTNRIPRASISKNTSITGELKTFYKVANSFETDGVQLRQTATGSVFESVNSFSFYINGTHTTIAIPNSMNIVAIGTSNDEDVTTNFTDTEDSISIPDAGGNTQAYKVYNFSSGVPLEATITITLS